tara:strand:+ start:213 stop:767 length:555 start_codon:yes stop_codon:yes gene_type:complete
MATGYWRIKQVGNNFELFDHLPNASARTNLTVKITVPGTEEATLLDDAANAGSLGTYSFTNPWSFPLTVEPADVSTETGSTFRDGVYRIRVDFDISATNYAFDEHFLYIPVVDKCISDKLDAYLKSSCDKCADTEKLQTLQELVVLRQGAQLDINEGRYTEAANKVTYMSNICTGSSCACICGC